jgi:hypothetical protein
MQLPPIIFDIARWLTMFIMFGGVATGMLMGLLFLLRPPLTNRWSNWFYGWLLITFSSTLLDKLLNFSAISQQIQRLYGLPIYLSFAFAPLLFFYVKSRLYPQYKANRNDFKHFILPTVQFIILCVIAIQAPSVKTTFQKNFFSPFYGNFEKAVFIIQFFLYLYFSYRFILHEKIILHKKIKTIGQAALRRQILVVGWLKRMVKGLFILFWIHAFFVLTDYFSFRFFEINLQSKLLFSMAYELSFVAMLFWLFLNGLFAWRRGL